MKPLWLELLLTPMAAPETRLLRAMRVTLLAGFVTVAMGVLNLADIARVLGRAGTALLAGLCVALAVLAAVYVCIKMRADAAHLDELRREDQP